MHKQYKTYPTKQNSKTQNKMNNDPHNTVERWRERQVVVQPKAGTDSTAQHAVLAVFLISLGCTYAASTRPYP